MPLISAGLSAAQIQQQTLAPQQQYALRILHMSAEELLEEAERAAEENPLLECDPPAPENEAHPAGEAALHEEAETQRTESESILPEDRGPLENVYSSWSGSSGGDSDDVPAVERVAAEQSLRDDLLAELGSLQVSSLTRELITCLIEELDDSGFLPEPIDAVAESYAKIVSAPLSRWSEALDILKTFDPPGIGASGPTEALALQAERLMAEGKIPEAAGRLLIRLLKEKLRQIAAQDRRQLLAAAEGDEALLDAALALLKTLNPHPASGYSSQSTQYVIADIVVRDRHGRWEAELNPQAQPSVRLSSVAQGLAVDEASPFGRYLAEARRLVSSIEARQSTLLRTAMLAVSRQQAFFTEGRAGLKPLAISEAASELGLSDSTVSRAVSGKFFQCPLGVFELRSLFLLPSVQATDASGMTQAVSPARIRARICALVAEEPPQKPLSDQALTERLNAEGFDITRRTVAKYRDLEGIPAARLRGARK